MKFHLHGWRIWKIDKDGNAKLFSGWLSFGKCKQMIRLMWGTKPDYIYISQADNKEDFLRYNYNKKKKRIEVGI